MSNFSLNGHTLPTISETGQLVITESEIEPTTRDTDIASSSNTPEVDPQLIGSLMAAVHAERNTLVTVATATESDREVY